MLSLIKYCGMLQDDIIMKLSLYADHGNQQLTFYKNETILNNSKHSNNTI